MEKPSNALFGNRLFNFPILNMAGAIPMQEYGGQQSCCLAN